MINLRIDFFTGELNKHNTYKLIIGKVDVLTRYDDKQSAYNVESVEDLKMIDLSLVKRIIYPNGKKKNINVLPPCISEENEYQTPELYYGIY
jgi:hypothetical protein